MGNIWFLSPLVLSKWEDLAFSVSRLFEKSVFILQFFNDKMHNYVKQNITKNFNIKKLNNKHTFLKTEKTKFSRWENLAFSVLRKMCLFFNFWIKKMHKCVKQNIILHFIIKKLKNKHTFLKKYTNWESWGISHLTEREERKSRYFPPKGLLKEYCSTACFSINIPAS